MSINTYFCFCCLSTNDLSDLFNCNKDNNYVSLLQELFSIKASPEDYKDDSYICTECSQRLKETHKFKNQVYETLNILKVNGLIELCELSGELVIKKSSNGNSSDIEEKDNKDINKVETELLEDSCEQEQKPTNSIKQENTDVEHLQITGDVDITRPLLTNDPVDVLERDVTIDRPKKSKEVTVDFKCKICTKSLPNVYVYNVHMNRHFPNHICDVCGKGYLTDKRLKRHLSSHNKGPFKCTNCEQTFVNYNTYCAHRRKHTSKELYACPHCAERFGTFTRRAQHLAASHARSDKRHACTICGKTFLIAGGLSRHMRQTHLKTKRYSCKLCGAGFFDKQDLTGHVAAHTGHNQFKCTLCPKSYPRKKALSVHLRTHTNDKRFICENCDKKFTQKSTLLTHMKTHNRAKNSQDTLVEKTLGTSTVG